MLRRGDGSSYGSMDRLEMTGGPGDVATRTVADIHAEAAPERVDFLSIDVEGLEADILSGFPFGRDAPELSCVEVLDTTLDGVTKSPVTDLLAERGYQVVGWSPPVGLLRPPTPRARRCLSGPYTAGGGRRPRRCDHVHRRAVA